MHTKEITFENFEGNSVTRTFWFHLSKLEIAELELTLDQGLEGTLAKLGDGDQVRNAKEAYPILKEIIVGAYGEKSSDGQSFVKSKEVRERFEYSPALGELIFELLSDPEKAGQFLEACLPAALVKEAKEVVARGEAPSQQPQLAPTPTTDDGNTIELTDEELANKPIETMTHEELVRYTSFVRNQNK